MVDDKDKHSEEDSDLENPSLPDTSELSLVEDDKPASPPSDDFDFDLDLDGVDEAPDKDAEIKELETRLMGEEYAADFPEPEPEVALSDNFTGHIEDEEELAKQAEPETPVDIEIPEDAEVEIIEESYMDAPFVEEQEEPANEFALDEEEEEELAARVPAAKPRNRLLQTIAKPEDAIRNTYRNSGLRQKLVDNYEWYRVRDENQRMEEILEETYGGAADSGFNLVKFVKNNVLASLLILFGSLVAIRVGIGVYFPDLLPVDQTSKVITQAKKPAAKKPAAKQKQPEKVIKVNYLNKAKIDSLFAHCLILPSSREILDQRFAKTGYEFSDRKLTLAHEEIVNITSVYDGLNIPDKVQSAVDRVGMLAHVTMPVIYKTRDAVQAYQDELNELRAEADGLRQRLESLSIGRQDTATINLQIKLRSDLDKIRDTLRRGPNEAEFARLEKALDEIDTGLTGYNSLRRIELEEPEEELPHWYLSLPDTNIENFKTAVKDSVLPEIDLHANALSPDLAELSRFHVRELTILLEEYYLVASQVMFAPENLLDTYNKDIEGTGRRLNELLASNQPEWLTFESCLNQARHDAIN